MGARGPTTEEQLGEQFRQIKDSIDRTTGYHNTRPYNYFGHPICRAGFLHLWDIGHSKLERLATHAQTGHTEPPNDLRGARPVRAKTHHTGLLADKFWLWMYNNVAESLAEGASNVGDEMDQLFGEDIPPAGADKTANTLVYGADDGTTGLSASDEALQPATHPRYLPPVQWDDINTLFDD